MDEVLAFQTVTGVVSSRYYPHYNHLYSVAALTDATGQVVERYKYDAYGRQTITAPVGGVVRAKSAVGWDRGFTGYVADNETGLLYARARMYSSGLGRFISRDPVMGRTDRKLGFGYRPSSRDGYRDGMGMYSAYFIPNDMDPDGTKRVKVGTTKVKVGNDEYEVDVYYDDETHEIYIDGPVWYNYFIEWMLFIEGEGCFKIPMQVIATNVGSAKNKGDLEMKTTFRWHKEINLLCCVERLTFDLDVWVYND